MCLVDEASGVGLRDGVKLPGRQGVKIPVEPSVDDLPT